MRTSRTLPLTSSILILAICTCWWPNSVRGERITSGDHVVTVAETPVTVRNRRVTVLDTGTNFRAHSVQGDYIRVKQAIAGREVSGWVRRSNLLKIDRNQRAIFATRDTLVRSQGQSIKLPKDQTISVTYESNYSIDIFVVSHEGLASYKWVADRGSGQMTSYWKKLNKRGGTFSWTPPDDRQYRIIVDNSDFPDGGANARRTIYYSLAYCIDDPKPEGPRQGGGLIIGRAILDFDGYQGRHERCTEPFKVVLKKTDSNQKSESISAWVDADGYFFVENVDRNSRYSVQKLDGKSFDAPATISYTSSFGGRTSVSSVTFGTLRGEGTEEANNHVIDVGCISFRVDSDNAIHTSIDGPVFAAENSRKGDKKSTTIKLSNDTSLDRHTWFSDKFPGSGWAEKVKADREEIIRKREEMAKEDSESEEKEAATRAPSAPPAP